MRGHLRTGISGLTVVRRRRDGDPRGRTIVRGQGIGRQLDLRQTDLLILEGIGPVGILAETLGATGLGEILAGMLEVTGQEETPEEIARVGILEAMYPAAMLAGIVLAGMRGATLEEIVRVEILEATGRQGMQAETGLRPITRGLRAILMRDFRSREVEAVIGHKGSGRRNRLSSGLSSGLNNSLNNGLSRDHRLLGRGRVGSAGITMPERRGRRAIAVEPVLVAAVETGEVETNETSQS